mgnify:CR=1 FL=1
MVKHYKIKENRNPVEIAKALNLQYYTNTPAANALIQIAPSPPGIKYVWDRVMDAGLFPYEARKATTNRQPRATEYNKIRTEIGNALKPFKVPVKEIAKLASQVKKKQLTMERAIALGKDYKKPPRPKTNNKKNPSRHKLMKDAKKATQEAFKNRRK